MIDDSNDNAARVGVVVYLGFWVRLMATLIDTLVLIVVTWPLLLLFYDIDTPVTTAQMATDTPYVLISYVLPTVAVILLWLRYRATPGKLLFKAEIVDATTLETMKPLQAVIRYFAYVISGLPLFLGFIWIAFDDRKQGWHDKIAGTVVIRRNRGVPAQSHRIHGIKKRPGQS